VNQGGSPGCFCGFRKSTTPHLARHTDSMKEIRDVTAGSYKLKQSLFPEGCHCELVCSFVKQSRLESVGVAPLIALGGNTPKPPAHHSKPQSGGKSRFPWGSHLTENFNQSTRGSPLIPGRFRGC
jgi:hypothetical protein